MAKSSWQTLNASNNTLLKLLQKEYTISDEEISRLKKKDMNEKYLTQHNHKITFCSSDQAWHTRIDDASKKSGYRTVKKKNYDDMVELIVSLYKHSPTFESLYHDWNNERLKFKQISPCSYDRHNSTFKRHFAEFGKRYIEDITSKEVIAFLKEENAEKELSSKAYNSLKAIIKGVFTYADENDLIDENAYVKIITKVENLKVNHKKKIKSDADQVFNEEELTKLYSYLVTNMDNIRNVGLLLMLVTGIRVGELVALEWNDLTLNSISIHKTESKQKTDQKNSKGQYITKYYVKDTPKTKDSVRTVILPSNFLFILQELLRRKSTSKSTYVFCFEESDRRMNTSIFDRRLESACKEIGISRKSCHKFRKTYVSILLDNGVDISMIKSQVGHADISTSELYYHKDRKTDEQKAEILSNIKDFAKLKAI